MESYILKLGLRSLLLALLVALIVGGLIFWFLTMGLRSYLETVTDFKNGNLSTRVTGKARRDLPILGETFNQMATKIESNIEDIKSAATLRKELVANISHDLRTPVMVIQGYAETLIMKKGTVCHENAEKYLNVILNGTNKLSRLTNQLFQYSKLESNEMKPRMEVFRICELIKKTYSNYEIMAQKKGISLNLQMDEELPEVIADITLTDRVLQNLMDNAIKFTPVNGKTSIAVKNEKKNIQIKIHNTGPIIPAEKLPFIFDRYQKSDKATTVNNNGAGLGLAIVKKILDLHNTSIKVCSKKGYGTAFIFEIPKSLKRNKERKFSQSLELELKKFSPRT